MDPEVARPTVETIDAQTASLGDIEELAALHVREMPGSNVSRLGVAGAACFYRFAAASPHETVLVASMDGKPRACAVFTEAPGTLSFRFGCSLARHPRLLAAAMPAMTLSMMGSFLPRKRPAIALASVPGIPATEGEASPELSIIFTDRSVQGTGLGSLLLRSVEEHARLKGHSCYFTRTNADRDNAAIAFYDRNGFEQIGYIHARRKISLLLKKSIPGASL